MSVCRICNRSCSVFDSATVLGKYSIKYYYCKACCFLQTEEPYWLKEAYQEPISSIDIGLASRCVSNQKRTQGLILSLLDANSTYLDFGAGTGLFVRLMRDVGFNFNYYDPYCRDENLFAAQHVVEELASHKYELVTAFEVAEHLPSPQQTFTALSQITDTILFSSELISCDPPKISEWWYYLPVSGQHISFFSYHALEVIAEQLHMNLYSNKRSLHVLSRKTIAPLVFQATMNTALAPCLSSFFRYRQKNKSLLSQDFFNVSGISL